MKNEEIILHPGVAEISIPPGNSIPPVTLIQQHLKIIPVFYIFFNNSIYGSMLTKSSGTFKIMMTFYTIQSVCHDITN